MSDIADQIELRERDGGVEFGVKVVPGSSRDAVVGVWGNALRVAVSAPPQAGAANQQLIRLLAKTFQARPGDLSITHGKSQPRKRVHIAGLNPRRVRQLLTAALRGNG